MKKKTTKFWERMSQAAKDIHLSFGNGKMVEAKKYYNILFASFDIPAGFTCPAADICLSYAHLDGTFEQVGRVKCYAAAIEHIYPNKKNSDWRNYEATKRQDFVQLVNERLEYVRLRNKKYPQIAIRIHSFGDFYDWAYFQKWVQIADDNPDIIFWGYSKQATFVKWLIDNPRDNMKFVHSHGSKLDWYADKHNLPQCYIIEYDGQYPGVPITCTHEIPANDFEYIMAQVSFGIGEH